MNYTGNILIDALEANALEREQMKLEANQKKAQPAAPETPSVTDMLADILSELRSLNGERKSNGTDKNDSASV